MSPVPVASADCRNVAVVVSYIMNANEVGIELVGRNVTEAWHDLQEANPGIDDLNPDKMDEFASHWVANAAFKATQS